MGCDIHMVVERKWGGVWCGVGAVVARTPPLEQLASSHEWYAWPAAKNRNYELFSKLAGVRGPGPEPRGLPDDVSYLALAELEVWGEDAHSQSWGLLTEVLPIFKEELVGELVLARFKDRTLSDQAFAEAIFEVPIDHDEDLHNYRLVYWFDN